MSDEETERSPEFRQAWEQHVAGNSFYNLDYMSQPEVDSFRHAFLGGWIAHRNLIEAERMRGIVRAGQGISQ